MKKNFWHDLKWLLNYITTVFMYTIIVILLIIGVILIAYFLDLKRRGDSTEWIPPIYGAYVIVSGSMEPTIMTMDAIVIKRIEPNEYKIDDIVTYKSEDSYRYGIMITHRIIDITEENGEKVYITKGDNNNTPDRLKIKKSQLYGKVVMVIPKIGYLQAFLATSFGWIIAIVTPCVGIIAYDVVKLIKNIYKNNRSSRRRRREV